MNEALQGRTHIRLSDADNVTTLLDDGIDADILADGTVIDAGIPFGHKVAIRAIAAGETVRKYGVVIGVATQSIRCGEHVHVHNCR